MSLDPELCYRAVRSRDRRFDGRFFTAVVTTGVYCRPICPAPTPKRGNVRFFPCASAAEEAGFRACLRCRPESSPGTPAWSGASATVSRALRLIAAGALDDEDVEYLAGRLGIGDRHLRRLFDAELGTSPLAVAQTRRAHFARRLLDETGYSIAEIASIAGFKSARRFNDVMLRAFGRPPRELRRGGPRARMRPRDAVLTLRMPFRPPYNWTALSQFLADRAVPGIERFAGGTYARTFESDGSTGVIEVRPVPGESHLELRVTPPPRALLGVVDRARRLFDCGADPLRIAEDLSRDATLARLLEQRPGLRVPGAWDGFELAVRAVLGQQITVKGAVTMAARLVEAYGRRFPAGDERGVGRLFPTAEALAEADLASIGLPRARAEALRALARAVRDGELVLDAAGGARDPLARMREIPGIGEWTAGYVAMRALGEPDAYPYGDLGLRAALERVEGKALTPKETAARAECWRPWRAYATLLLWTHAAKTGDGNGPPGARPATKRTHVSSSRSRTKARRT